MVASGFLDQLAFIRCDGSLVHSPQEVDQLGSVAPEGRVDLHVAVASAVQLRYLLLTVPLSFNRPDEASERMAEVFAVRLPDTLGIRRTYYRDQGWPVETADIVVPAAHCEIVYEIPINR